MWKVYPKWTSVLLFINVQLSVTYCGPFNLIFFCKKKQHKLYQIFLSFPNFRKVGKFAASIKLPQAKSVSASGGFGPWSLDQGLCLDSARGSAFRTSL